MLKEYEHHAQYYETDQMGCVHHSNFIRWMEEARIDMMEQMGCGYRAMEEAGIMAFRQLCVPLSGDFTNHPACDILERVILMCAAQTDGRAQP